MWIQREENDGYQHTHETLILASRLVDGVDDKPAELLKACYSLGCWLRHSVETNRRGDVAPDISVCKSYKVFA